MTQPATSRRALTDVLRLLITPEDHPGEIMFRRLGQLAKIQPMD